MDISLRPKQIVSVWVKKEETIISAFNHYFLHIFLTCDLYLAVGEGRESGQKEKGLTFSKVQFRLGLKPGPAVVRTYAAVLN